MAHLEEGLTAEARKEILQKLLHSKTWDRIKPHKLLDGNQKADSEYELKQKDSSFPKSNQV